MKTPLALHNLWHQGVKTLVSIGGVAFALLLVFMQLGFMGAVSHTATNLLQNLKFDALIRARDYLHLYEPGQIERRWLATAANTDGVVAVRPLWITIHNWRKLPTKRQFEAGKFESQYLPIAVMAFEPHHNVFELPEVETQMPLLAQDDAVLLDDSTQAEYGPWETRRFTNADIGRDTDIGGRRFRIQGLFKLGTGLAANGALITSHRAFSRITPWDISIYTSLGLVEFESHDPIKHAEIIHQLRQRVRIDSPTETDAGGRIEGTVYATQPSPNSAGQADTALLSRMGNWLLEPPPIEQMGVVDILSKDEAIAREKHRWLWQTPFGLIFQMGVLISLLVGAAIVYMVLSTDVANRLSEYATLLAMGYSRRYLSSIVMTQAIVLCLLGFLSAWGIAEVLYRVTYFLSGIPLMMNPLRVLAVALLGLFMCCVSGLLALRKLWKAEPASLF